jgi:Putative zinc-finger
MNCEAVRELLPDHTLGTLSDEESAALRSHLRGCTSCRSEAGALDEGMALFASAAHATEPPRDLERRVLSVLQEEWADGPAPARPRIRWLALAAALVFLAGALTWAGLAQVTANRRTDEIATARALAERFEEDATSYREFLSALGGREVRVAVLAPTAGNTMDGSAILYDSTRGQSWVVVFVQAPGSSGTAHARLVRPDGRFIKLFPLKLADDGDGATWLVTSADISAIRRVEITDRSGQLLASGIAPAGDH